MGVQLERVTFSPENSLTFVVDDIMRQRPHGLAYSSAAAADMEHWLNALQRQARPLVHSARGRAGLEAWLEAVDAHTAQISTP